MKLIRKIFRRISIALYSEHTVADFYRKTYGVKIGNGCRIMDRRLNLFGSEPYLIEIGDKVTLAENVRLITHDGGVGVLREKHPGLNVYGCIVIHDNCFIGVNSVIMPRVCIGPNAVVGAGAVVTRSVPADTVVAGVPAKVICTIKQYEDKAITNGVCIVCSSESEKKSSILDSLDCKKYHELTAQN